MRFACNLTVIISILYLSTGCNNHKFDKNLWETRDVHYPYRKNMVKDLMKNHLHKGMTYKEVVDLLGGDHTRICGDTVQIVYEVDVRYFGIDPVKGSDLYVNFTADSILTDFSVRKWSH